MSSTESIKKVSNIIRKMTFSVILEHKQTQKLKFVTVEDCIDMDDCIDHIMTHEPDFQIEQIKRV